jgi:hypothetical protein
MTYIINLGKAWFHVNNRHTCDHRVDASINTMKYLNSHIMVVSDRKYPLESFQGILVVPYVS